MNILVSACLLGVNCKYDGGNNANEKITALSKEHTLIPVCPEQLGGLCTPRNPSEIRGGSVCMVSGEDVTENYKKGAAEALKIALACGCTTAILKAKSPSCGYGRIYDGTFSKNLIDGNGITADLLSKNGIQVYSV